MFNKDKLIQKLEEKGWSAYRLSKVSGVAQATISEIINGIIKNPNTNTIKRLAIALDVPLDYFFYDSIDMGSVTNYGSKYSIDGDIDIVVNAMKKMSDRDRKKTIELLKITFEYAFNE